jgi:hypothetical protein
MKTPRLEATHLCGKQLCFITERSVLFRLHSGKRIHISDKIPRILRAITESLATNTTEPSSKCHTCLEEHTHKSVI